MTTRRSPPCNSADPPKPVEIVELPKPLPLPGQLKPLHGARIKAGARRPAAARRKANAAARVQPTRNGYINAVQVYPFSSRRALSGLCRAGAGD